MIFRQLSDNASSTYTHLIADRHTTEGVLIDPLAVSARLSAEILDRAAYPTPGVVRLFAGSAVRFNRSALPDFAR